MNFIKLKQTDSMNKAELLNELMNDLDRLLVLRINYSMLYVTISVTVALYIQSLYKPIFPDTHSPTAINVST